MTLERRITWLFGINAVINWTLSVRGIVDPGAMAALFGAAPPNYPFVVRLWQGFVFMFGWMFWEVSRDPRRKVALIKYNWIEKTITALAITGGYVVGEVPTRLMIVIVLTNWAWIPFILYYDFALRAAIRHENEPVDPVLPVKPGAGMSRTTSGALVVLGILVGVRVAGAAAARTWTFERDTAGAPPPGFSFAKTDGARPGRWIVRTSTGAPSGDKVLAQVDDDRTDGRFALAVADEPSLRDLRFSVKCKPVSGDVDQACGLVFRYGDENNYYVARANALEDNVNLYHVVNGKRRQFAGWKGGVAGGEWHSLRVDAVGDHFEVYWDDRKIIDSHDKTFSEAGKVGLWTKADSVTEFDDLIVEPLGAGLPGRR